MTAPVTVGGEVEEVPAPIRRPRTPADKAFRVLLVLCASSVLVVIVGIVYFLLAQAGAAWEYEGLGMLTSDAWVPRGIPPSFGFLGPLVGSLTIALVALLVAVPISIATSLAINEYAPRRVRRGLTALVDLLAALPSIVFGLWGLLFLNDAIYDTTGWLATHADFVPVFRVEGENLGQSLFLCGLVVGIMVIPIITSISREIMAQTPRDACEAALALGGTRWGMITDVILPFGRNGIVGATLLGFGRAMGETIAVSLILLGNERLWTQILQPGGGSISALIVKEYAGSSELTQSALTVAGLTLFAIALAVNFAARMIVLRNTQQIVR